MYLPAGLHAGLATLEHHIVSYVCACHKQRRICEDIIYFFLTLSIWTGLCAGMAALEHLAVGHGWSCRSWWEDRRIKTPHICHPVCQQALWAIRGDLRLPCCWLWDIITELMRTSCFRAWLLGSMAALECLVVIASPEAWSAHIFSWFKHVVMCRH